MSNLARNLWLFPKKRGHRRSGSGKLAALGEALFFAVVFLAGCVGLVVMLAVLVVPQWRVGHRFVAHHCVVRDKRVGQITRDRAARYHPEIQISYQVEGETYSIWTYALPNPYSAARAESQAVVDGYTVGQTYPCWYDPADPSVAVLVRANPWWSWLSLAAPASFILIGGGSFAYRVLGFGTSAERRSAMARRASRLEIFEPPRPLTEDYPFVPEYATITDSPGTRLAYRLAISSPAWPLLWLGLGCAFWNGLVAVFVLMAVGGFREGRPDWWLAAGLVPFVAAGIGLIVYFIRQVLVIGGVGPSLVEVSAHPFRPGRKYQVLLSQVGRLSLRMLELQLVCEEEATFRQGTHTRTERRCVWRRSLFSRRNFELGGSVPFETQCEAEIPDRAMHSFKAAHNELNWKLVVKGRVVGWPEFCREFPVVVYPAAESPAAEKYAS